jgi:hypothetical protein
VKLKVIADIRTGYPFRSRLRHDPEGSIAVVQMKDIDDSNLLHPDDLIRVSLSEVKASHLINRGDLVFRSRGRTNTVALIDADVGPAILAAPMILIRPLGIYPAYLHWFVNQESTQQHLAALAAGTSLLMISKASLSELEVAVPSLEHQQKIVECAALGRREQELMNQMAGLRKHYWEGVLMRLAKNTR